MEEEPGFRPGPPLSMNDSVAPPAPQVEAEPRPPDPPTVRDKKKRRWPTILWICAPFLALLAWWIFSALQPLLFTALPYTQAVAFAAVGIVGLLYKDKYTHPVAARVALWMFILFGTLMAFNAYRDRTATQQDKKRTADAFDSVNGRIAGMQTDLRGRADKTDTALSKISGDLNDFKNKVRPNELEVEMAGLRDSMHRILNPPKATLGFTFIPFFNPPPQDQRPATPLKEISRAMDENRVVSFDITAINFSSDVTASGVDLSLIICDPCTFAKEPKGFTRLKGDPEHVRYMKVGLINAKTTITDVTVDVTVPPGVTSFQVGFDYRCAACILPKGADMGIVHVTNPR